MARYQVSTRVEHGCCYKAMVIDTNFPTTERDGAWVCEAHTPEIAQQIADVLNASGANIDLNLTRKTQ